MLLMQMQQQQQQQQMLMPQYKFHNKWLLYQLTTKQPPRRSYFSKATAAAAATQPNVVAPVVNPVPTVTTTVVAPQPTIIHRVPKKAGDARYYFVDYDKMQEVMFNEYESKTIDIQYHAYNKTKASIIDDKKLLEQLPSALLDIQRFAMMTFYSRTFEAYFVIDFNQMVATKLASDVTQAQNNQQYKLERYDGRSIMSD
eukprot:UN04818